MRVILLSIAFLFLAFSAQSQILKSAGVWYFLDVDSMAARPAVLPNGTEIAYVVGTRDIYCWNRTSSAWEICVPAVDSTVFATLHAVGDSIAAALGYVAANFFPLQGGTLTGTGGNGFVGFPLQSSPPSTPSTGFSLYAGSTGNNISWMQPDGFFRRLVSPVTGTPRQYQFMARSYTLADSADVAALPTGSGTTNYYAKWSSATALGVGNLFDNNTVVSILNNKPFSLGQWTTAGRPAGTTGYMSYNTTGNGIEWYQGTRWAYALESTFARGTNTYVPFFDANGQLTQSSNLYFNPSANGLVFQSASTFGGLFFGATRSPQINFGSGAVDVNIGMPTVANDFFTNATAGDLIYRVNNTTRRHLFGFNTTIALTIAQNTTTLTHPSIGGGFLLSGRSGGYLTANQGAYAASTSANDYFSGSTANDLIIRANSSGNVLIGADSSVTGFRQSTLRISTTKRVGINVTPTQDLDVYGDAYIRDSTRLTTTPAHSSITGLLTRDANGWVGLTTLGTGLSYSGGVLSASGSADGNGIYTGSATLSNANTRALISPNNKLSFSQVYNSGADSARITITNSNSTDGFRAIELEVLDTVHTGGRANLKLVKDSDNDIMSIRGEVEDQDGATTFSATGNGFSVTATNGIGLLSDVASEVQITGLVKAKQEAYNEITSTSSPQTLSSTYSDNLINQGGTQATFTLNMPASPEDGQVCTITYNNSISTLTIDGNGETIVGSAVVTAVPGSQRKFKFYSGIGWIKIY